MRSGPVCASQRTNQGLKYLLQLLSIGPELSFGVFGKSAKYISSTLKVIFGDNLADPPQVDKERGLGLKIWLGLSQLTPKSLVEGRCP